MDDVQYQMAQQPRPNYYNQNGLQPNPLNDPSNPYNPSQPYSAQPYAPQPMYPPPPPPMQPGPMNSPQQLTVFQVVSSPSYPPCPFCQRSVPTIARRVTGQAQLFWCFVLFLVFPLICCIPFCM